SESPGPSIRNPQPLTASVQHTAAPIRQLDQVKIREWRRVGVPEPPFEIGITRRGGHSGHRGCFQQSLANPKSLRHTDFARIAEPMADSVVVFFDIGDTLAIPEFSSNGSLQKLNLFPFVLEILHKLAGSHCRLGIISNTGNETKASLHKALSESGLLQP